MVMDEPPPYEDHSSQNNNNNNSSSSNSNDSKNIIKLFPIYKVTLGKTTVKELEDMGYDKNNQGNNYYYTVNCINFWVEKNIAHHMYLTRSNSIPEKWFEYGFSWSSSYNQWLDFLNKHGFNIEGIEFPKVVQYQGHDSFAALIKCSITMDGYNYKMHLDFNYNFGSSADHNNTLYSLRLRCD